ncbi:unnamed protein product [Urochloa humidicola]
MFGKQEALGGSVDTPNQGGSSLDVPLQMHAMTLGVLRQHQVPGVGVHIRLQSEQTITECTRSSLRMHDEMLCNIIKGNGVIYIIQKKRMISCNVVICNAIEPVMI